MDAVKEKFYERGSDVDIKINTVEKMNDSYEAMTVTPEGSNIGMNMNLKVIEAIMGHRNIETTMDIYAEATERKKQESFEILASKLDSIF